MVNAKHDQNARPAMIGVSSTDGVTVEPITADAPTHALNVSDGTTGSDMGNNSGIALIDENGVSVMCAESSAGDGTLVELYVNDSTGRLLVKTT